MHPSVLSMREMRGALRRSPVDRCSTMEVKTHRQTIDRAKHCDRANRAATAGSVQCRPYSTPADTSRVPPCTVELTSFARESLATAHDGGARAGVGVTWRGGPGEEVVALDSLARRVVRHARYRGFHRFPATYCRPAVEHTHNSAMSALPAACVDAAQCAVSRAWTDPADSSCRREAQRRDDDGASGTRSAQATAAVTAMGATGATGGSPTSARHDGCRRRRLAACLLPVRLGWRLVSPGGNNPTGGSLGR